jgi:hypothetical protein
MEIVFVDEASTPLIFSKFFAGFGNIFMVVELGNFLSEAAEIFSAVAVCDTGSPLYLATAITVVPPFCEYPATLLRMLPISKSRLF